MKHKLLVLSLVACSFILFGCQKKSTVSVSSTGADQIPQSAAEGSAVPAATGSQVIGSATQSATGVSGFNLDYDDTAVGSAFTENYQEALADANGTLKNQAKFCNIIAEFAPSEKPSSAKLNFFFSADAQKDWYWLGQKDQLENQKKRMFAAKRDYKEITCSSLTVDQLAVTYAKAYEAVIKSGKISLSSSDVAKIKIYLDDKLWRVDIWKNDSTIVTQTVSTTLSASTEATASAVVTTTPSQ
jgi:hypothetical protein